MINSEKKLKEILFALLENNENECVEYKKASNDFDVDRLGKYFSAISNEANLHGKQYGWIIFGVDDKTHEFVHTNFYSDNNFNSVKKQIADNTTDNVTFIEIYSIVVDGKRVIMFQVPAASGTPLNWKGYPYGRNGESLMPLSQNKIEQIKATANNDWSRQIIEEATINNLDSEAIKMARAKYKEKYKGKAITEDIDFLTDEEFLSKAKLTLNGNITYACMLLLGKEEDDWLMGEYNTRITWKLFDDFNIVDYEHFHIPFIFSIDKAKDKIRILRYRYMINENSMFPLEVFQYDDFALRELINNAVAHQDYRLKGSINIQEYSDSIIIRNEGSFIPETVDEVLKKNYSSPYYRNQFLAQAMVNLNMIDSIGYGIRKIYEIQRDKYFPMPDYNLDEPNRVMVTLYGKILDEDYSRLLFKRTDLSLEQVILLDKVQKKYNITKEQADYLRKSRLIEGRYPNIFISLTLAKATDRVLVYMKDKGIDNKFYKDYIVEYIKRNGSATRKEINELLIPKFPSNLSSDRVNNKIRYLLKDLKVKNVIINKGTDKNPKWILIN